MNIRFFNNKVLGGISFFSVLVLGLLLSVSVSANQVFTSDCAFGFKDVYGSDEAVCATGDVDTTPGGFIVIFPEGDVCIVAAGTQVSGAGIADVTAGGCNTVVGTGGGGAFFDEFVWLPPLTPGLYDILLDENQNGAFDGPDVMGNRFQVGAPVGVVIDVVAIKGSAGGLADKYESMATAWKLMSDSSTAVAIGFAISSGDVFSAVVGSVSLGLSQFGIDFPTDYNAGVIAVGGKIIAGLAGPLGRKYRDLEADPPDPAFTDFVALDLASVNTEILGDLDFLPGIIPAKHAEYPLAPLGDSSHELAQIGLKNQMAVQAALVAAVTSTFEKYQGAEIAGNDTFTYLQARMLKNYTDQLIDNMDATRQALIDYRAELAAAGLDAVVFTAVDLQIIRDRIVNLGFTPQEITEFKAGGFSDAAIAEMRTIWSGLDLPVTDFSRGGLIDTVIAAIDSEKPVFQALASQAQAVMDDLAPFLLLQHPVADAGGPYAGTEGAPIALNGSDSTDPNNDISSYEWDIDLDGVFGDAVGAFPDVTFNQEFVGTIGLRVTDAAGNSSVDYADVAVASVNGPPVITAFTPVDPNPSASPGSPVNFSVTAEDPDFDPLSFEWSVDEVPVSTDTVYSYEPLVGETGTRLVKLTVSDGNPFSPDVSAQRVVQLDLDDVTPPQIQILGPVNGAVLSSSPVTVSGTVSDNAALDTVTVNGVPAVFGGGTFSASVPLALGTNSIIAIAIDTSGNTASMQIQVTLDPNDPPAIISAPVLSATEGQLYSYDVDASDPDGDVLTYALDTAPVGMSINSGSGLIQWTPVVAQVGSNAVTVRAADGDGAFDTQSFTVNVVLSPDVTPPQIEILSPASNAVLDSSPVMVSGTVSDNRALDTVTVNGVPAAFGGGTFSASVPLALGTNSIIAIATDTTGNTASMQIQVSFELDVTSPQIAILSPANGAVLSSSPVTVSGSVSDNTALDTVTVNGVPAAFGGGTFSASVPLALGTNSIIAIAIDTRGNTASMQIQVTLDPNDPPAIISAPVLSATEGQLYSYDVDASDPDGDVLTYSLDTAPVGMSIDPSSGLIQWTPVAGQAGLNPVTVRAGDGRGGADTQSFSIDVADAGAPPDAPENLLGRAKGLHVNIAWSGSDTAENFRIFRRTDSEIDFTEIGQSVTRVFVDDLPLGTLSAEYFVVAENTFGQSGPSGIITVVPTSRRSR